MKLPAKSCPSCGERYDADVLFCPRDGTPLASSRKSPAFPAAERDPYQGLELAGQIQVRHLIGIGSMGRVYRAFQAGIERDVAVKILHRELSGNAELVRRFHREAKVASRLVHPNVVQVLMTGSIPPASDARIGGELYLVMEHLDGISLLSALAAAGAGGESEALPLPRALHIALQICDAVGEAHAQGIVHRDLKPENVMLVRRGEDPDFVKVLDFGIARLDWADKAMTTQAGLIFGTAKYISPEGAEGHPVGPPADVYSIATMLYQCLAGRAPFEGDSPVALLVQHTHAPPPDLRSITRASYVPAPIAQVVMQNLAKKPGDRAPDARALGRDLALAVRASGLDPDAIAAHSGLLRASAVMKLASKSRTKSLDLSPALAAQIGGVAAPTLESARLHELEQRRPGSEPDLRASHPAQRASASSLAQLPGSVAPVPDGMAPLPGGMTPLPGGMTPLSAGMTPLPSGMTPLPAGVAPLAGMTPLPGGMTPLPAGTTPLPGIPHATVLAHDRTSHGPSPSSPTLVDADDAFAASARASFRSMGELSSHGRAVEGPARAALYPGAEPARDDSPVPSTMQGVESAARPLPRRALIARIVALTTCAAAMGLVVFLGGRHLGAFGGRSASDSLEAHVERARSCMGRHAWDTPPGENVKDIIAQAHARWPADARVAELRRESSERIVAYALGRKYAGDRAGAIRLAKLALEIQPDLTTAQHLVAELTGSAQIGPEASPPSGDPQGAGVDAPQPGSKPGPPHRPAPPSGRAPAPTASAAPIPPAPAASAAPIPPVRPAKAPAIPPGTRAPQPPSSALPDGASDAATPSSAAPYPVLPPTPPPLPTDAAAPIPSPGAPWL